MVETRAQTRGAPLKKPGAYNTDLYYQEKDEGYGDVGVGQEPDAGVRDDPSDPSFEPSDKDLQAATETAAREDADMPEAEDAGALKGEVEDLKAPAATGEPERDVAGEPVPVVEDVGEDEPPVTVEEGRDVE